MNSNDNILKDKTPSLFVVTSPFQAMCAIEAIESFKISDYLIIASCGNDSRDKQLLQYLNEKGVKYVVDNLKGKRYYYILLTILYNKKRRNIRRAFLGDTDNMYQYLSAYKYLCRNSFIAFMDDGTKNIPVLKGERKRELKKKYHICEWIIRNILNIKITNSFFTLYYDIATSKFECRPNSFSHIATSIEQNEPYGIYYIGTNSKMYCRKLNLSEDAFMESLDVQFSIIKKKYVNQPIIYIPHGRDINMRAENLCKKHNIQYHLVDKSVEIFIMNQTNRPMAIYANTSTALFNLKLFYPEANIVNIFCIGDPHSKYFGDYVTYSKYFEKHGIPYIDKLEKL